MTSTDLTSPSYWQDRGVIMEPRPTGMLLRVPRSLMSSVLRDLTGVSAVRGTNLSGEELEVWTSQAPGYAVDHALRMVGLLRREVEGALTRATTELGLTRSMAAKAKRPRTQALGEASVAALETRHAELTARLNTVHKHWLELNAALVEAELFVSPVAKCDPGRFELAVLAAHEASRAELDRRGVPSRVVAEGVEWRQSPMRAMSYGEENRGRMVPIGPVDLEPAVFVGSLAEGPFVLKVTGPNTAQVRITMRVLYTLTWA